VRKTVLSQRAQLGRRAVVRVADRQQPGAGRDAGGMFGGLADVDQHCTAGLVFGTRVLEADGVGSATRWAIAGAASGLMAISSRNQWRRVFGRVGIGNFMGVDRENISLCV
jgi:hypothetical protein